MFSKFGVLRFAPDPQQPPSKRRPQRTNWTKIQECMRYVFALFRKFHNSPEVFSMPYPEVEMAQIKTARKFSGLTELQLACCFKFFAGECACATQALANPENLAERCSAGQARAPAPTRA
jgi:hypothetical protein